MDMITACLVHLYLLRLFRLVMSDFCFFYLCLGWFVQDDLMAELEELEQEELDEALLEVHGPATDNLPSVPTAEPVKPGMYRCMFWSPK